MKKTGR